MRGAALRIGFVVLAVVAGAALPASRAAPDPAQNTETVEATSPPSKTEAALEPEARKFLELAEPLLSEAEKQAYRALQRPYQRRAFEKRFWQVRDPFPETAANEFADGWLERAPKALDRYGSLADARGLALAAAGEPETEIPLRCPDLLRPLEVWRYAGAGRIHSHFVLVFVSEGFSATARFRAWSPRDGLLALTSGRGDAAASPQALFADVASGCTRGEEVAGLLQVAVDWQDLVERGALVPRPNDEWVRSFAVYSTDLPAGARPLPAALEIEFPGRRGLRTRVEGAIRLKAGAPRGTYTLDGEVLREGELFEHFRYRFQPPADAGVPFVFERPLRPGPYDLVVKLHDLDGDRYFREQRHLQVPVTGPPLSRPEAAASAAPVAAGGAVAETPEPSAAVEPSLRLFVPEDRLLTGKLRVEAAVRGDRIATVAFSLDGKPVLSKLRPPYDVELDLGHELRLHRIGAVAYDATGVELARDEAVVNGGPHRFALRLVEPQAIPPGAERVEARALVDVPAGESLDRVEFYVDDTLYATLYQPPFEQSLPVPHGKEVAWIRAVAYLAVGGAAEDVKLVGAGPMTGAVDVDLVELYTSMLDRRGRPVDGVTAKDVEVLEDGKPQRILRFEQVKNLPLHAGVLLDTSASMAPELEEAERAALRFFTEVLTDRDRATVITFADAPHLAVPFTRSVEVLAGGLAHLEADGETALWDAVAFALHDFSGIRGKRALILITDGQDSHSRYRFEEVLEYARRTGVAIYPIGLHVPSNPPQAGMLLDRLARETGGRTYRIERAVELGPIYAEIERELRSQYLIAYQSPAQGSDFREVKVKVKRSGIDARTIRGYYP